MKIIGGQDMVSPIKKILVKHPRQAFIDKFKIKKKCKELNFLGVPDYIKACSEYESMGCNVLTVEPKKVIMVDGNPKTKSRLEKKGVHVFTYDGSEISLKGAGGPTCLTKPILRVTTY